jgi:hypothetical protein
MDDGMSNRISDAPPRQSRASLIAWVGRLEASLGLYMAALLGVLAICAGPIYRYNHDSRPMSVLELLIYGAIGLPLAIPAVISVAFIRRAISELPEPRTWMIAARQPRFAKAWRPVVALWWLLNFGACVWIVETWTQQLFLLKPTLEERALTLTLQFGLMFGASFAGNLFLLLAADAIFQRGRVFEIIRRGRFVLDGVMVGSFIALGNL